MADVLDPNGLLTPCGEPTGYLTSDRSYKNFVLSIEFRCGRDTNSGVFVRSPQENGGYEVQIWRLQPLGYNTGTIVDVRKTARVQLQSIPDRVPEHQDPSAALNSYVQIEVTVDEAEGERRRVALPRPRSEPHPVR
jgi:hypothetical protein